MWGRLVSEIRGRRKRKEEEGERAGAEPARQADRKGGADPSRARWAMSRPEMRTSPRAHVAKMASHAIFQYNVFGD